ncbi:mycofactocin biosynthesis glycosyltransferase MftF [Mycolicibacterium brumae]|uniref:Mycofactocin system glycosyltransferase n=1 Tax=Mycolicibacterium brumae TaxID=85968 RepID=A0A2G5PH20_9MYCO|nr:mycofactocin biosynthesis glycosyltransferase MftF [Mycolicibacterium brumae]MCV7192365.1 mycofactocin biosynthesis glycosyltransferase MftF [Mycolicibacterium brumae]PIB77606.1 mycofactocin system glycosyltransferase [Mycolicibacterium brumae]UWW10134.1 mycofactocin biosynthesis glycosyltransferase MftF [Mycolicibacterium brumae]
MGDTRQRGPVDTAGPRLPDGFAVQVDRRVRVLGAGTALLGGSPARLLRLQPEAGGMLDGGRLEVRDAQSAELARTLLDATVAHPRPASGPSYLDVTIVIPVCDNIAGVVRLLNTLRGMKVIVVDDGSVDPLRDSDFDASSCDVRILRNERPRGRAAARNLGLAACQTDFVAFLDSDVTPRRGWMEALLGHFCDPAVALVAPRIVGMPGSENLLARYEAVRSSLDLGKREAPVVAYGAVSHVPSAAIVARVDALRSVAGFDESMSCGEDIDLCWRLTEVGARLRYEPIALVSHDYGSRPLEWMKRRAQSGLSSGPLAERHPGKVAPVLLSAWSTLPWLLLLIGTRLGAFAAVFAAGMAGGRLAQGMRVPEATVGDVAAVAARGLGEAVLQLASAICRHYWPVAAVAALLAPRWRHIVLLAAVVDGVADWLAHRDAAADEVKPIGPLAYLLIRRLDDMAYGAGLWASAVRGRTIEPLLPQLRS